MATLSGSPALRTRAGDRPAPLAGVTAPGPGGLPPEIVEACRFASLQLGGPRLVSLGVTSALRGEGRSTIARAMAEIQDEDYERTVVLLDLDLERPSLSRSLGAAPAPGIAELVDGTASLDDVIQPLGEGISLVAAGASAWPASRTMAGILRAGVLRAIEERFDAVIADLPPLLSSSVGRAPAAVFGDLLLVVRSGVTPLGRIRQATAHLPVQPSVLLNGTRSHLPPWLQRLAGC
jgi:succinoglycan biosynthesis transport protein ExoP